MEVQARNTVPSSCSDSGVTGKYFLFLQKDEGRAMSRATTQIQAESMACLGISTGGDWL